MAYDTSICRFQILRFESPPPPPLPPTTPNGGATFEVKIPIYLLSQNVCLSKFTTFNFREIF